MLCYFQVYGEVIQLYIRIYLFFQIPFPYRLLQNIEYSLFPVLYSRSSLVIYFICSSVYVRFWF